MSSTSRPSAAPTNHGAASAAVERTLWNPNPASTPLASSRSNTRKTTGTVAQREAEAFGPLAVQIVLIVIAAPISEELCFRGMLYGGLRERLPRYPAALITGLIFGGLHATTGISAVPPLIVFGFLLALLYERTGSIVPGILLHTINNSIALLGQ